jgi:hypothetical protein
MLIFKALHIVSMFTMVTLFSGGEVYYAIAIFRRDIRALAWLHRVAVETGIPFVALGALVGGVVFGLLTVATGGFDYLEGWLIAAYLLVVAFFVNSFFLGRGVIQLGREAAEVEEGKRPAEEVVSHIGSGRTALTWAATNAAIFVAIILDMVLKPF